MVVVSAAAHMMIVAAIIVLAPYARLRPLPMQAYTVELTDARELGGRLPPGPPTGELGGPQKSAAPEPKGQPEAVANAPEPAAAERWRSRAGGLGGTDTGSGPIGAGGEGKGGGGQLVGLDFMVYRQAVITTIKGQWTNVFARPGLVAKVRFEIAPDGTVSDVRLEQSSGNSAYDLSAIRAVQHANPLPPPPARYASEFHEFLIEFRSEETGGQGAG